MDVEKREEHLSHIATLWTVVARAHQGADDEAALARARLIEQYGPAIHRYLLGAVRNNDLADELFQEFALRLVRGDFAALIATGAGSATFSRRPCIIW